MRIPKGLRPVTLAASAPTLLENLSHIIRSQNEPSPSPFPRWTNPALARLLGPFFRLPLTEVKQRMGELSGAANQAPTLDLNGPQQDAMVIIKDPTVCQVSPAQANALTDAPEVQAEAQIKPEDYEPLLKARGDLMRFGDGGRRIAALMHSNRDQVMTFQVEVGVYLQEWRRQKMLTLTPQEQRDLNAEFDEVDNVSKKGIQNKKDKKAHVAATKATLAEQVSGAADRTMVEQTLSDLRAGEPIDPEVYDQAAALYKEQLGRASTPGVLVVPAAQSNNQRRNKRG